MPGVAGAMLEMEEEEIRKHLKQHLAELCRDEVDARILMGAFWAGSVTSKVVALTKTAILLIPIRKSEGG